MSKLQGKRILMVIAPEKFKDEELFEPKTIFESRGAEVVVTATKPQATSVAGETVQIDEPLSEITLEQYHAIIFVGGPGVATYFKDQEILDLAKAAYNEHKLIGAICMAPSILANAGLLKGKKVTTYESETNNLKSKGAECTGKDVEVDGNIVTASGPQAAKAFGEKIVELLIKQ